MRIGELAARTGIAVHTIRFYEREGLLNARHSIRAANNYRTYNAEAVERLLMIREGQAAGFTLTEISHLMAAWDAGNLDVGEQAVYLRRKIDELSARILEIERMRAYLVDKLARMTVGGGEKRMQPEAASASE
jgi:MerR family transcriptional regulator, copper efflux regulator